MQEEITAIQKMLDTIVEFGVNYSFQIIGAIIILIAGVMAARWLSRTTVNMCERKELDVTLSKFISRALYILVITFTVIIAMGKFGITIAPFIAALGAAAFGASFALQGPMSNYGAGIVIIITRPFVVGDTISIKDVNGVVQEVSLGNTILLDEDGVVITIPNKHIVGEIIYNSGTRRIVECQFGIGYKEDYKEAIRIIKEVLSQFDIVIEDPAPQIGIQELADSAVKIGLRYWVPSQKYFVTSFAVNLSVHSALQDAGFEAAFPRRDLRIVSQQAPPL